MSDPLAPSRAAREVYTPSALTRLVRDLLEDALPLIWLEGEISNFSRPASGHLYFTLKDGGAQVRCAMFRPRSTWLRFKPADGMHVLARVRVSLYEARGEFQLIVDSLEESGEGALQRAFEQLKAKLAAEGLFEAALKRALPPLPRRIGVLTSASGAAVRDVLSVIARRFPLAMVEVLPVPVQGREAPAAIVAMLHAASRARRHDVLLLTRGGGSLEDLWAFNDEGVARAIRASAIPVVSAIGHEIDFTIADFAADLRAPTPSAAAELLVPDVRDLSRALERQHQRALQLLRRALESRTQRIDHLLARLNAQRPQARLARADERLHALRRRLLERVHGALERRDARARQLRLRLFARHPAALLARRDELARALIDRLRLATRHGVERRRARLGELARTLHAVSPLATLERGYAILLDADGGEVVRSVTQAPPGRALRARLADGEIAVAVKDR
ncbi:exodeoxyribonuclease VII large subunit [Dokdonella fugitiva]|uniref:Exodeoxyribonuclease 7 large subunit n=1 Tax=Dokdonella fugitiva TaxID=328517 RepID=A0A839EZ49_9GAMM|nr:exodeoxyribonuclease VII large subunit [Dokdonella fugitiva]MBA8889075.1 exodeoxyribonuclease VII large subunit [Dokdonella fugitiva]